MASRFWVGGGSSTNWAAITPSNWSATSGGANNVSLPANGDSVFFDAASGSGIVNIAATTNGVSIDFTGSTITVTGASSFALRGNLKLSSGITWSHTGSLIFTTNSANLTSAGKTFGGNYSVGTVGITVTLLDSCVFTGTGSVSAGTLDMNGFNLQSSTFSMVGTSVRALLMGSGTYTLTSAGTVWNVSGSGMTITPGTSTIKLTGATSSGKIFAGADLTYNNLWFTGAGTGTYTISGSNTFNDLKYDNTSDPDLIFTAGTTQTVSSFTVNGQTLAAIKSSSGGTPFTLSKSSGTVTVSRLNISDSTATGGATWDASNGTNVNGGGNTGWVFPTPAGGHGSNLGRGGAVSRRKMGIKINT